MLSHAVTFCHVLLPVALMLSLPSPVVCCLSALNEGRVRPVMYKQEFVGPILHLIQEHCPDVSPRVAQYWSFSALAVVLWLSCACTPISS